MAQNNFKPMQETLTEVLKYVEHLEVLDATEKKTDTQKKGNELNVLYLHSEKVERSPRVIKIEKIKN